MERKFEAQLVNQCAPTLAGIKPASLFRYQGGEPGEARALTEAWCRRLAPWGLTLRVLKTCCHTGACMILLYRAEWLRRYISFVFILFVIALGTSLSIRANLGSSPISAPSKLIADMCIHAR